MSWRSPAIAGDVVDLLSQRVLLFDFGECLVQLAAVGRDNHLSKQCRTTFAVGPCLSVIFCNSVCGVGSLAFVRQRSRDTEVGVDKVWLDSQRFVVLHDRFVEPTGLQQQFRV